MSMSEPRNIPPLAAEPASEPGQPPLVPYRDIIRLRLDPGDKLIARVDRDVISSEDAARVKVVMRAALDLPDSVAIMIVSREWDFAVVSTREDP